MRRTVLTIALTAIAALCFGQETRAQAGAKSVNQTVKASAAYAEILLKKTELESDVESMLISYTEEYPKVKEGRYELALLQKDLQTLLTQTDSAKLTLALGKLMTRRADLATDLWQLQERYGADHPEVKRARRKFQSFDSAVKDILP